MTGVEKLLGRAVLDEAADEQRTHPDTARPDLLVDRVQVVELSIPDCGMLTLANAACGCRTELPWAIRIAPEPRAVMAEAAHPLPGRPLDPEQVRTAMTVG